MKRRSTWLSGLHCFLLFTVGWLAYGDTAFAKKSARKHTVFVSYVLPNNGALRRLRCSTARSEQPWHKDPIDAANILSEIHAFRKKIVLANDPRQSHLVMMGGGFLGNAPFSAFLRQWYREWETLLTRTYEKIGFDAIGVGPGELQYSKYKLRSFFQRGSALGLPFLLSNLKPSRKHKLFAKYINKDGVRRSNVITRVVGRGRSRLKVGIYAVADRAGTRVKQPAILLQPAAQVAKQAGLALRKRGVALVVGLVTTSRTRGLKAWLSKVVGAAKQSAWGSDVLIANTPKGTYYLWRQPDGLSVHHVVSGAPVLRLAIHTEFSAGKRRISALSMRRSRLQQRVFSRPLRRSLRAWETTYCLYKKQRRKPTQKLSWTRSPSTPGKVRWVYRAVDQINAGPAAMAGRTIAFGTTGSKLYNISPQGRLRWKHFLGAAPGHLPPKSPGGVIVAGSRADLVTALNASGRRLWKFNTMGPVIGAPAFGKDGTIYVGARDTRLYALSPQGKQKWSALLGSPVIAGPTVAPGGTIVAATKEGSVFAFNAQGKRAKPFRFSAGRKVCGRIVAPIAAGRRYFASCASNDRYRKYTTGGIIALDAKGSIVWFFPMKGAVTARAVLTPKGDLIVGNDRGYLHKLSGSSGARTWSKKLGGSIVSAVTLGPKGTIYVGTTAHQLWALKPDGTKRWQLDLGFQIKTSPLLIGDPKARRSTLYVAAGPRLFAINPHK